MIRLEFQEITHHPEGSHFYDILDYVAYVAYHKNMKPIFEYAERASAHFNHDHGVGYELFSLAFKPSVQAGGAA